MDLRMGWIKLSKNQHRHLLTWNLSKRSSWFLISSTISLWAIILLYMVCRKQWSWSNREQSAKSYAMRIWTTWEWNLKIQRLATSAASTSNPTNSPTQNSTRIRIQEPCYKQLKSRTSPLLSLNGYLSTTKILDVRSSSWLISPLRVRNFWRDLLVWVDFWDTRSRWIIWSMSSLNMRRRMMTLFDLWIYQKQLTFINNYHICVQLYLINLDWLNTRSAAIYNI